MSSDIDLLVEFSGPIGLRFVAFAEELEEALHSRGGFSLVEMLVVLLTLGIMATSGFPPLMGYAQEVPLEQQAQTIYQDLCLVRDTVLSVGEGTDTMRFIQGGTGDLVGYEMIGPTGDNVRTALMDECVGVSGGATWPAMRCASRSPRRPSCPGRRSRRCRAC